MMETSDMPQYFQMRVHNIRQLSGNIGPGTGIRIETPDGVETYRPNGQFWDGENTLNMSYTWISLKANIEKAPHSDWPVYII